MMLLVVVTKHTGQFDIHAIDVYFCSHIYFILSSNSNLPDEETSHID